LAKDAGIMLASSKTIIKDIICFFIFVPPIDFDSISISILIYKHAFLRFKI